MVKNYSDDWTDNDFDFVVNSAYLESEQRVEVVLIHDRKLNQHFREPVFYEVVTVKGIATNQKREVIHQKHIPWHMVSKGYKYVVRDKQTGRFVKWVK